MTTVRLWPLPESRRAYKCQLVGQSQTHKAECQSRAFASTEPTKVELYISPECASKTRRINDDHRQVSVITVSGYQRGKTHKIASLFTRYVSSWDTSWNITFSSAYIYFDLSNIYVITGPQQQQHRLLLLTKLSVLFPRTSLRRDNNPALHVHILGRPCVAHKCVMELLNDWPLTIVYTFTKFLIVNYSPSLLFLPSNIFLFEVRKWE